jgi:hypothetical protein
MTEARDLQGTASAVSPPDLHVSTPEFCHSVVTLHTVSWERFGSDVLYIIT